MEYTNFIIDYSLFLINNFNYTKNDAALDAQDWWDFIKEKNERIKSFRINKRGKPSIQTHLKKINMGNDLDYIEKLCRNL